MGRVLFCFPEGYPVIPSQIIDIHLFPTHLECHLYHILKLYIYWYLFFDSIFCSIDSSIWWMKNDSRSRTTLFKLLRPCILKHRRASSLSLIFLLIFGLFALSILILESCYKKIHQVTKNFSLFWRKFASVWFLEYCFPLYLFKSSHMCATLCQSPRPSII